MIIALSFFISFLCGMVLFPYFIRFLRKISFNQPIYELAPADHAKKASTPTMGGLIILVSTFLPVLFYFNYLDYNFLIILLTVCFYGLVGFFDDYKKIKLRKNSALTARAKSFSQFLSALVIVGLISYIQGNSTEIHITPNLGFDLGWFYYLFAIFIIIGSSNAVNLTDGLDGLAISSLIVSFLSLAVISLLTGNVAISLFLLSIIGSSLAFLWFNTKPAQIFMGDIGSLSIGAALAVVSILLKVEFLLFFFGFVYVMETLSVILQVGTFKLSSGKKRMFRMAPIHHHFELMSIPEEKIVARFFIASCISSALGLLLFFLA